MGEVISQRLKFLRGHLAKRLKEKLTASDVALAISTPAHRVTRMEAGLQGNTETFVALLLYYREHGYNIDWILTSDNTEIPMMLSSPTEMLTLAVEMKTFSQNVHDGFQRLNSLLITLGYEALETTSEEIDFSDEGLSETFGFDFDE